METPRQSRCTLTPPSTASVVRQQEKEELGHLNQRLASYIHTVHTNEVENAGRGEGGCTNGLKDVYQRELNDARRSLDREANERAQLQLELSKLRSDYDELADRNAKREADVEACALRLRDLEALLNSKEAELSTALGERHTLEAQHTQLKDQLVRVERGWEDTKEQLRCEVLRRVDTQNQLQTQTEENNFQKALHEKELCDQREELEKRVAEVNRERQEEVERKLNELRHEQQRLLTIYKDKLQKTYQTKLENAHLSADTKNHRLLSSAHEELQKAHAGMEEMSAQLCKLQQQVSASEAALRAQEAAASEECELVRRSLSDRELKVEEQLKEFQELLGLEPTLRMEIKTYDSLLEGEEQRLRMTPAKRQGGSSQPSRSCQCPKRRRRSDSDSSIRAGPSSSNTRISQRASAYGPIAVEQVDLQGKFIRFKNMAEQDQSLGGWQVRRQVVSSSPIVYKFPAKFTLKAGATVTVWAEGGGGTNSPPTDLVWVGRSSWGSGDVLETVLISAGGKKMASRKVTRTLFMDGDEDEDEDKNDDGEAEAADPPTVQRPLQGARSSGGGGGGGGDNEYNLRRRATTVLGHSRLMGSDGPRQGSLGLDNCSLM